MINLVPKSWGKVKETKVILLNTFNLELLRGYKAEVVPNCSILPDYCRKKLAIKNVSSVTIEITGLSNKGAKNLLKSLLEISPQEFTEKIHEEFK